MKNYKFTINGKQYSVDVADIEGKVAQVEVNGTPYEVELEMEMPARPKPVARPAAAPQAQARPAAEPAPVAAKPASAPVGDGTPIKSPLPGVVLDVFVKAGDNVKAGQHLLLLEAMKMENNIDSDKDGVVKEVRVQRQDSVMEGDVLVVIA